MCGVDDSQQHLTLNDQGTELLVKKSYQEAIERLSPGTLQSCAQQVQASLQPLITSDLAPLRGADDAVATPTASMNERRHRQKGRCGRGSVRVMARVRPLLFGEDSESCLRVVSQTQLEVLQEPRLTLADHRSRRRSTGGIATSHSSRLSPGDVALTPRGTMEARSFMFDTLFEPGMSDDDVFNAIRHELTTAVDGEAVCILAYGATGSGKTHTVMNLAERAAKELERQAQILEQLGLRLEIMVQIVEIYNEQLRDLLAQDSGCREPPRLKLSCHGNTPTLQGAALRTITGGSANGMARSLQDTFRIGQAQRATSATAVHGRSSRSHLVMKLFLSTRDAATGTYQRTGKLSLVDLAGSERLKHSEVQGERLREAQHINRSLSALADVVAAKEKRDNHVPYRNSKLTHMLQDTLGDQCRTVIIVALPPTRAAIDETLHSLQFSARLSMISFDGHKEAQHGRLHGSSLQHDPPGHCRGVSEETDAASITGICAEAQRLRGENTQIREQLKDRERCLRDQECRIVDCQKSLDERDRQLAAQWQLLLELIPAGDPRAVSAIGEGMDVASLGIPCPPQGSSAAAVSSTAAQSSGEAWPGMALADEAHVILRPTPSLSDLDDASSSCSSSASTPLVRVPWSPGEQPPEQPVATATWQAVENSVLEPAASPLPDCETSCKADAVNSWAQNKHGGATLTAKADVEACHQMEESADATLAIPCGGTKTSNLVNGCSIRSSAAADDNGPKELTCKNRSIPTPARARARRAAAAPKAASGTPDGAEGVLSPLNALRVQESQGPCTPLSTVTRGRTEHPPGSLANANASNSHVATIGGAEAELCLVPASTGALEPTAQTCGSPAVVPPLPCAETGRYQEEEAMPTTARFPLRGCRPRSTPPSRRSRSASERYVVKAVVDHSVHEGLSSSLVDESPRGPRSSPRLLLCPGADAEDSFLADVTTYAPQNESQISVSSDEADIKERLSQALLHNQGPAPSSPLNMVICKAAPQFEEEQNCLGAVHGQFDSGVYAGSGSSIIAAAKDVIEKAAEASAAVAAAAALRCSLTQNMVPPLPQFNNSPRNGLKQTANSLAKATSSPGSSLVSAPSHTTTTNPSLAALVPLGGHPLHWRFPDLPAAGSRGGSNGASSLASPRMQAKPGTFSPCGVFAAPWPPPSSGSSGHVVAQAPPVQSVLRWSSPQGQSVQRSRIPSHSWSPRLRCGRQTGSFGKSSLDSSISFFRSARQASNSSSSQVQVSMRDNYLHGCQRLR